jgi:putative membrane protein
MIKTFRLAGYELRRFKGPLPILALLFLVLVPLMYGALYLWSNWDPYGKLDQVPVAVVNQDQPVVVNGKTVDAGSRLVSELEADPIFDWQFVDEEQAAKGLADGQYYLTIIIPPDFSADLASGATQDPQRAVIYLHRDDVNGYVIGLLTASVQTKLEGAIDRAAIGAYFDSVFTNLDSIRGEVTTAAGSATKLAAGAKDVQTGATGLAKGISAEKDGSAQLVTGLTDAKSGSAALVTGATTAQTGSAQLVAGLGTLQSSASELVTEADGVASGNQQLADTAVPVLNQLNSALSGVGQSASDMKAAADKVNSLVASNTLALSKQVNTARTAPNEKALSQALDAIDPNLGGRAEAAKLAAAVADANTAAGAVSAVAGGIQRAIPNGGSDLSTAATQLTTLATGSQKVATGVSALSTGISDASTGASTVDSGLGDLVTGATSLDTRIGQLQTGAKKLDDGLTKSVTGSAALVDGATKVADGADQLAKQLTEGAKRIPSLTQDQRDSAEQVLSSPADVRLSVDNPAVVYGRGLAPFFFGIAIWVFGIAVFLVMRPISNRALAGRASSPRITVAGWLPVVGLAAAGSLILLVVVWLGLGLNPVNVGGSIGVVLLAAAAFTAIAHLLRTWLGVVGSAVTLVLLMVQLTSAGGLYPVQTLPAPFRAIHTVIPMTYLINALRITFTGGPTNDLWRDVGVLAGFTVVAVGLCVFVVHRRRRFRMKDLHPALG